MSINQFSRFLGILTELMGVIFVIYVSDAFIKWIQRRSQNSSRTGET